MDACFKPFCTFILCFVLSFGTMAGDLAGLSIFFSDDFSSVPSLNDHQQHFQKSTDLQAALAWDEKFDEEESETLFLGAELTFHECIVLFLDDDAELSSFTSPLVSVKRYILFHALRIDC